MGESNLEHIFPKKPYLEWENPDDLELYLWAIGNLTMLGKRLNNTAASKGFPGKKEEYAKSSVVMSQEVASQYDKWGYKEIFARAKTLVPLVLEIWNFDNPSRV